MPVPEKLGPFKALREKLNAARKDRAFLKERSRQQRVAQQQRRRWENAQKAAEKKHNFSHLLDLPGVWLAKRRRRKILQEANRQYAQLGDAPPLTPVARMRKAVRTRLDRATADRERLWRRLAGAMGVVAAASLVCSLVIYFRFTPSRPLVTIGSRVIEKREYQNALDAAAGKPVLTDLVFSELIRQAAARAGLAPTPAQIDTRLSEIEQQGTPLPDGLDAAQIRVKVGLRLALENLRTQGISASDAEIADFYRKNAAQLTQPARVKNILVLTRSEFEAQAATDLLAKGRTAAEIAAQSDMRVAGENGFHLSLDNLPLPLRQKVRGTELALHPNQIATVPLGSVFLTIKCLHKDEASQPPLSQIRDKVAALVKLSKAPSANVELARLYQANRPRFDIERYNAYFNDVEQTDLTPLVTKTKTAGS